MHSVHNESAIPNEWTENTFFKILLLLLNDKMAFRFDWKYPKSKTINEKKQIIIFIIIIIMNGWRLKSQFLIGKFHWKIPQQCYCDLFFFIALSIKSKWYGYIENHICIFFNIVWSSWNWPSIHYYHHYNHQSEKLSTNE